MEKTENTHADLECEKSKVIQENEQDPDYLIQCFKSKFNTSVFECYNVLNELSKDAFIRSILEQYFTLEQVDKFFTVEKPALIAPRKNGTRYKLYQIKVTSTIGNFLKISFYQEPARDKSEAVRFGMLYKNSMNQIEVTEIDWSELDRRRVPMNDISDEQKKAIIDAEWDLHERVLRNAS